MAVPSVVKYLFLISLSFFPIEQAFQT